MDIRLPNQAFKQVWNGQMILNRDGMCEWGPGNTVLTIKDGQSKGSVRRNYLLPELLTSYSGWLVSKQRPKVDSAGRVEASFVWWNGEKWSNKKGPAKKKGKKR